MRIVTLHGQLGMASDWDAHGLALGENGHELVAVDLWNYLAGGVVGMREFGRMINEVDGEVLMGYSMGGRLALQALIDAPQKWKAVVIVSTHTGLAVEDERESRCLLDAEWARKVEDLPWTEFLDEWNRQGVLGNDVMPDRSDLELKKKEIARSFRCWSLGKQEDLLEKLASVEIPILWVVGEEDEKFCMLGEQAAGAFKNARLIKIPNSGHRVPWEAEGDFLEAVERFIRDVL